MLYLCNLCTFTYLCFAYCDCTVVFIVWTIGQVLVLCTAFCALAIGSCCFYTLHYVSLSQLLKLNDDDMMMMMKRFWDCYTVRSDLLRRHVERHRSQIYFCVRIDTRQNEKYSCTDTQWHSQSRIVTVTHMLLLLCIQYTSVLHISYSPSAMRTKPATAVH